MRRTDLNWVSRIAALLLATIIVPGVTAQETGSADTDTEMRYEGFPQIRAGRLDIPTLQAPSIDTENIGNGRKPEGFDDRADVPTYALPESASQRAEDWNWTVFSWAAANTFSNPRYFEDRMLERHGHQRCGDHLQPFASGARFFATVPMLPYLMAVRDPCDCEYTLGYYRSGSRAPALFQRPPLDRRAVLMESAVVAAAMVAFP